MIFYESVEILDRVVYILGLWDFIYIMFLFCYVFVMEICNV